MTARDKIVILVVVAAASLAGLWFLVLAPQREEAGKLSTEVDTQRKALADAEAKVALARQAKAGYASNYTTIAQLGKAVPADDDLSSLIVQLEFAARDADVDFRSVRLDEQAAATAAATSAANSGASGPSGPTGGDPGAASTSGPTPAGTGPTGGTGPAGGSAAAGGAAAAPTPLPFSFTFEGHFLSLARFFRDVDRFADARRGDVKVSGRLMTVEGISLAPSQDGFPMMTAKVRALTYVAPPLDAADGAAPPVRRRSTRRRDAGGTGRRAGRDVRTGPDRSRDRTGALSDGRPSQHQGRPRRTAPLAGRAAARRRADRGAAAPVELVGLR